LHIFISVLKAVKYLPKIIFILNQDLLIHQEIAAYLKYRHRQEQADEETGIQYLDYYLIQAAFIIRFLFSCSLNTPQSTSLYQTATFSVIDSVPLHYHWIN
jgi:hypothetical protein